MKKIKGITLIELMIVMAIIVIVAFLTIPLVTGKSDNTDIICGQPIQGQSVYQETISKCIGGYLFAPSGAQIINSNGGGISCQ